MATEEAHGQPTALGDDPPPKYLGSLIGSINDGAKSAQTSALFLNFVGLYLAATAISVSDLDLLKGATIQVSQLGGVNVPIIATFLLGPIVFFVLHAQLLIRYRMLVTAVRLFCRELTRLTAESDRARCRELLANVEFVLMLAGRDDQAVNTPIYRLAVFVGIALIPIAVLLAVQISFLRYQSVGITWAQRIVLIVDLAMVVAFYYWLWSSGREKARSDRPGRIEKLLVLASCAAVPVALVVANFAYVNVPAAEAQTVRYYDYDATRRDQWWRQPLDLVLCPHLNWGCRYLDLSSRLLADKTSDGSVQVLRSGKGDVDDALAAIDGVSASNRTLRFANFNQSQAYKIDLSSSDLRNATFWNASLQGAKLAYADLRGANLELAHLQNADLYSADLRRARLAKAYLSGAKLQNANLRNANLTAAQLDGANLFQARLQGATLDRVQLVYADLRHARMSETIVRNANLHLADLSDVDFCTTSAEEEALEKALPGEQNQLQRQQEERHAHGGCEMPAELQKVIKLSRGDEPLAQALCQLASSDPSAAAVIARRIVDNFLPDQDTSREAPSDGGSANELRDAAEADARVRARYMKVACCLGDLPSERRPRLNADLQAKLTAVISDCR